MRPRRCALAFLVAVALLAGPPGRAPVVGAADRWRPIASESAPASSGVATPLGDGQVLFSGGSDGNGGDLLDYAVRYDPATERFSPAARMHAARGEHTATTLLDGRVLVAGGWSNIRGGLQDSAELYDPAADRWVAAGPLNGARARHTATLLADGRVLIAGGIAGDIADRTIAAIATAEIYDPATDRWTPAAPLADARIGHTATLLPDGTVLVAGGSTTAREDQPALLFATAERYDPAGDTWIPVAPLPFPRTGHTATLLPDGQLLVTGGDASTFDARVRTTRAIPSATAELFDPATGQWTATGAMAVARARHHAVPLPSGQVLVARSGADEAIQPASPGAAELYDPASGRWAPAASLADIGLIRTATLLADGQVLVTGNRVPVSPITAGVGPRFSAVYDEGSPAIQCFAETGQCLRGAFLTYWQEHGGLALNGYPLGEPFTQALEDGRERTVQYCERTRLEYHPENEPPGDVLLGQFGRRVLLARAGREVDPPAEPIPGQVYFAETGHNLGGRFREYWEAGGGLAQFGFPLGEELEEELEEGKGYVVQYCERARFEYHQENAPPYDILLGQFGRQILAGVEAER